MTVKFLSFKAPIYILGTCLVLVTPFCSGAIFTNPCACYQVFWIWYCFCTNVSSNTCVTALVSSHNTAIVTTQHYFLYQTQNLFWKILINVKRLNTQEPSICVNRHRRICKEAFKLKLTHFRYVEQAFFLKLLFASKILQLRRRSIHITILKYWNKFHSSVISAWETYYN